MFFFLCEIASMGLDETKSELQTFLRAVLLRGRWHWVSCSGKGTHYWQRAWPVIPGPGAGRMDSVTYSFNECHGHSFFIIFKKWWMNILRVYIDACNENLHIDKLPIYNERNVKQPIRWLRLACKIIKNISIIASVIAFKETENVICRAG